MLSHLLPGDYALLVFTAGACIVGLFRGFSGMLAFFLATAGAAVLGVMGWPITGQYLATYPTRIGALVILCLLAFGLVRKIVKKLVNGLLAQPSDAFFGMLVGVAFGVAATAVWALTGVAHEYSQFVRLVAERIR